MRSAVKCLYVILGFFAAFSVNAAEQDLEKFFEAISLNDTQLVEELLSQGVQVNAADDNGKTALMFAVESGNEHIVKILLRARADVNAVDNNSMTALGEAAFYKHPSIVQALVAGGADIDSTANFRGF